MSVDESELKVIQELSARLVDAQSSIRILDSIKWDDSIRQDFFRHKGQQIPAVDKNYYMSKALPFDANEKQEEFRLIVRDANNQLGLSITGDFVLTAGAVTAQQYDYRMAYPAGTGRISCTLGILEEAAPESQPQRISGTCPTCNNHCPFFDYN